MPGCLIIQPGNPGINWNKSGGVDKKLAVLRSSIRIKAIVIGLTAAVISVKIDIVCFVSWI